jgi:hypothetical protein
VWEWGLAVILLLGASCPRVAHPQQLRVLTFPAEGYGREAFLSLARQSAVALLLPRGDTLWLGNLADTTLAQPGCDTASVVQSRFTVAVNHRILGSLILRERGRGALVPSWVLDLPDGSRLRIVEAYRRKATCGIADGLIVVWLVIAAPVLGART